ncbi:MAG: gallidermin family lantibiotic [Microcystis sp. M54BS1]|nr:gallidermin family lantibiotic [Microcystis sp. M54BS1]
MKIDPNLNLFTQQKTLGKDVFDLDVKLTKQATDDKVVNQLVTSKSLCTPTCPNGTMHSFCC